MFLGKRARQAREAGNLIASLSSIGETEKRRLVRGRQSCCFSQKFPGEKGSVRRCVVVMQQPVLLSPKFGSKFSHIFTHSLYNVTVVCVINCLAYQDELFVSNPFDVKENDEHALNFALHLSRLFRSL
jgi:hypothetical protein